MTYAVSLIRYASGQGVGQSARRAVKVEDRRDGAFDLIAAACKQWGTTMERGEVYRITPSQGRVRYYRVVSPDRVESLRVVI